MATKRKGGQETVRDKKRLLLLKSSENCCKINEIFSKSKSKYNLNSNLKVENEDTIVPKGLIQGK